MNLPNLTFLVPSQCPPVPHVNPHSHKQRCGLKHNATKPSLAPHPTPHTSTPHSPVALQTQREAALPGTHRSAPRGSSGQRVGRAPAPQPSPGAGSPTYRTTCGACGGKVQGRGREVMSWVPRKGTGCSCCVVAWLGRAPNAAKAARLPEAGVLCIKCGKVWTCIQSKTKDSMPKLPEQDQMAPCPHIPPSFPSPCLLPSIDPLPLPASSFLPALSPTSSWAHEWTTQSHTA